MSNVICYKVPRLGLESLLFFFFSQELCKGVVSARTLLTQAIEFPRVLSLESHYLLKPKENQLNQSIYIELL